jgi:hypothetical protein
MECFGRPVNILQLSTIDTARLHRAQAVALPALVVINTLRKAHILDDKESETPTRIYGAWRGVFPSATLLFIHHDKKESSGTEGPLDQRFSGSQAWQNDVQVAFHLTRMGGGSPTEDPTRPPRKLCVRLTMTKSQVSDHEAFRPIILQLQADGSNFREIGPLAYAEWFAALDPTTPRAERIAQTQAYFGVSRATIFRAVKGLE